MIFDDQVPDLDCCLASVSIGMSLVGQGYVEVPFPSQIFEVPVYGQKGEPLNAKQIETQLRAVIQQSQVPAVAVGALTSANRDRWYSVYTEMSQGR